MILIFEIFEIYSDKKKKNKKKKNMAIVKLSDIYCIENYLASLSSLT